MQLQIRNHNHKAESTTLTSTGKGGYLLSTRIIADWIDRVRLFQKVGYV